jgi:hypothetical protein
MTRACSSPRHVTLSEDLCMVRSFTAAMLAPCECRPRARRARNYSRVAAWWRARWLIEDFAALTFGRRAGHHCAP